MTRNEFVWTKTYDVDSKLIEGVFFNENDRTVVLDVKDTYYRYSGVDAADIAALVEGKGYGGSVGRHYTYDFKHKFGPAEKLGAWENWYDICVPVNKTGAGVAKDLTTASVSSSTGAVTHFSISSDGALFQNVPTAASIVAAADEPTKEFSLATPPAPEPAVEAGVEKTSGVRFVVHFTLNDFEKTFKYEATKAETLEDALNELNQYVSAFGAKGKVRKVVVKFD